MWVFQWLSSLAELPNHSFSWSPLLTLSLPVCLFIFLSLTRVGEYRGEMVRTVVRSLSQPQKIAVEQGAHLSPCPWPLGPSNVGKNWESVPLSRHSILNLSSKLLSYGLCQTTDPGTAVAGFGLLAMYLHLDIVPKSCYSCLSRRQCGLNSIHTMKGKNHNKNSESEHSFLINLWSLFLPTPPLVTFSFVLLLFNAVIINHAFSSAINCKDKYPASWSCKAGGIP